MLPEFPLETIQQFQLGSHISQQALNCWLGPDISDRLLFRIRGKSRPRDPALLLSQQGLIVQAGLLVVTEMIPATAITRART